MPGRNRAAVYLGIHPGKLGVGIARMQQALGIHKDAHARPLAVALDDGFQGIPCMLPRPGQTIGNSGQHLLQGKGIPQGRVH